MTAADVLRLASAAGMELTATPEGKLRWRSRGPLAKNLRRALAANKLELLTLIQERDNDALTCRLVERDLGLPLRSLTLWEPIRPALTAHQ